MPQKEVPRNVEVLIYYFTTIRPRYVAANKNHSTFVTGHYTRKAV